MCGIAGFVLNELRLKIEKPVWLVDLSFKLSRLKEGLPAIEQLSLIISTLNTKFSELMSCRVFFALQVDNEVWKAVRQLSDDLDRHETALVSLSLAGHTELDPVIERLRDMSWQLKHELLGNLEKISRLLNGRPGEKEFMAAYAIEHVLTALDRLEVRGRDSAGIYVQVGVPAHAAERFLDKLRRNPSFIVRAAKIDAGDRIVAVTHLETRGTVIGFTYKTANLVGCLGDNGAALRAVLSDDELFWSCLASAEQLDVLAHTRWASSGVISVANCHPHNAVIQGDRAEDTATQWISVLNGDVDNHIELKKTILEINQYQVDSAISTDAKIIPIACRFINSTSGHGALDSFRNALRYLDGSMAIATLNASKPGEVFIAQKEIGRAHV